MNITLKQRIGPITDLQRKRFLAATAMLMRSLDDPSYKRLTKKVRRWK